LTAAGAYDYNALNLGGDLVDIGTAKEGRLRMLRSPVEEYAKIRVVGVGGGGSNAVNRMIEGGVMGVEYMAINTDRQVLDFSAADVKIALGENITNGLGTGGNADLGRQAAEESRQEVLIALDNADMVFVTAGMGGGTGTGGSPIVAEVAHEMGALTVGVVTKPFAVEGKKRMQVAEEGIKRLKEQVDTLIVIPNDRLLELTDDNPTLQEAFAMADEVLRQGVRGISEVIVVPGLINLDFADVRAVMKDAGTAMMGIGEASGENRAAEAARAAVASPLLETDVTGARSVLLNITGGADLALAEVHEIAEIIQQAAAGEGEQADLILGAVQDDKMEGSIRVTVLATGFDEERPARPARRTLADVEAEVPKEVEREGEHPSPFREELPTYDEDDIDIPAFLRRR